MSLAPLGWIDDDQEPSPGTQPVAAHARAAPFLPDLVFTGAVPARHAAGRRGRASSRRADPPRVVVPFARPDLVELSRMLVDELELAGSDLEVTPLHDGATLAPRVRRQVVLGGVPDARGRLVLPEPLTEWSRPPEPAGGAEVPERLLEQVQRLWAVARTAPETLGGVPDTPGGLVLPGPTDDLAPIHHRALLRLVLPGSEMSDVTGRHGVLDPTPRRVTAHVVVPPSHAAPRPIAPTARTMQALRTRPAPPPLRPAFRRSTWWQATAGGIALAVGVPAAAMMAPTALGGGTSWTIVVGHSMEPNLDPGDLVFTRAQDTYGPGDVVVYTIPEGTAGAGVMIIHRIVGGDAESGYLTRGDNREYNDPWRPTPDDITGKHWRTIDGGGNVVVWMRSPIAIAGLLGVTAFVGTLELARKQEEEEQAALAAHASAAAGDA